MGRRTGAGSAVFGTGEIDVLRVPLAVLPNLQRDDLIAVIANRDQQTRRAGNRRVLLALATIHEAGNQEELIAVLFVQLGRDGPASRGREGPVLAIVDLLIDESAFP